MKGSLFTILVVFIVFASCKKNEETLSNATLNNIIRNSISSYDYIPLNSADTVLNNYGIVLGKGEYPGVPVHLTENAKSDIAVTCAIDYRDELLEEYDKIYNKGVPTPKLPKDVFELVNGGNLTVKSGNKISTDSLKIKVSDYSIFQAGKNYEFVIPVTVQANSNEGILKTKIIFLQYFCRGLNLTASFSPITFNSTTTVPNELNSSITFNYTVSKKFKLEFDDLSSKAVLDAYNKQNGTVYQLFPTGSYSIEPIEVPKNTKTKTNAFQVVIKDKTKYDVTARYLLPFKVKNDKNGTVQYLRYAYNVSMAAFLKSFGPGLKFSSMEFRPATAKNTLFEKNWNNMQLESVNFVNRYIAYIRFSFLSSGQLMLRVYRYQAGNGEAGSISYASMYFEPVNHEDGGVSYSYIAKASDGSSSSSSLRSSSSLLEAFLKQNKFRWDWNNTKTTEGGLFVLNSLGGITGESILGTLGTN